MLNSLFRIVVVTVAIGAAACGKTSGKSTSTGGADELVYEADGSSGYVIGLALAVDKAGQPHLAWETADTAYHIRYSGRSESGWSAPIEPAPGDFASGPLLGADGVGGLHLIYRRSLNSYIWRSPDGTWSTPESLPDIFANFSSTDQMAVDATGGVHILYYPYEGPPGLLYSYRPPAGPFSSPETMSTEEGDLYAKLAVGASGTVFYAQMQSNQVKLRRREGSGWSTPESIPTDTKAVDIILTPDGAWHLFFKEANGIYRHRGDPAHGWPAGGTIIKAPQGSHPDMGIAACAGDREGGLHAFWMFGRRGEGDGDLGLYHVSHTHTHPDSGWSDLQELYSTTDTASMLVVAGGTSGCVHLTRRDRRQVHYMKICP